MVVGLRSVLEVTWTKKAFARTGVMLLSLFVSGRLDDARLRNKIKKRADSSSARHYCFSGGELARVPAALNVDRSI
jgi:hypothetical protein